jgi:hypothetical protein
MTIGLEKNYIMLELFIEANGLIDAILDFSQEGVMALVLIALSVSGRIRVKFKFCLLVESASYTG